MTQETRTALLDAAEQAARARGFDGFSYADLAEAVGIRKASIHYHFPSKADLSAALMDRYHAVMQQACADIDAQNDVSAGRLRALIALYRAALNEGTTMCLCVVFVTGRESLSPDVTAKITAFRAMMTAWLTKVFERAAKDRGIIGVAHPQHEARATLALLEGAHIAARAEEDVAQFDEAVALLQARC
ncbi:TetR/AcrR family transcriptional regulator [Gymnodinialimonas sp. 2305UL16-5]|uniref:TetR/AcrR family transcriptional regulator n=1 Tax=Gymnodinialimonas mytili TaxID=3126503 RepID=UPI0030AFD4BA